MATAQPETSLWDEILSSSATHSARLTPKTLLVVGDSKSGKSTLVSQLGASTSAPIASTSKAPALDLGLSFSYLDVRDEAEEGACVVSCLRFTSTDTVARLSVYELGSCTGPHTSLLPLTLGADSGSLLDSLAVIVLDWTRPWTFLDALRRWLSLLERVLHTAAPRRTVEEGRDRGSSYALGQGLKSAVEASFRSYAEPGSAARDIGADPDEPIAPLPSGTLSDNLGLPVVVVCAKARNVLTYAIDEHSRTPSTDWSEIAISARSRSTSYSSRFGRSVFAVRTLHTPEPTHADGAGLFFTSRLQPATIASLRSYILHRLFQRPQHVASQPPDSSSSAPAPLSATTSFPFTARANVVDRDQVLVPAGWDSWGKIRVLREGFDAERLGKGWQRDIEPPSQSRDVDEDAPSAARTYETAIPNVMSDNSTRTAAAPVQAQDEQDFLRRHFDRLLQDQSKDPRANYKRASASGTVPHARSDSAHSQQLGANFATGPGVVGPMGSSSLNLPSVENALNRDAEDPAARLARLSRKDSGAPARGGPLSPNGNPISPPLASPSAGGPTSPGQTQNEVLANFFSSLLSARSSKTPTSGTAAASSKLHSVANGTDAVLIECVSRFNRAVHPRARSSTREFRFSSLLHPSTLTFAQYSLQPFANIKMHFSKVLLIAAGIATGASALKFCPTKTCDDVSACVDVTLTFDTCTDAEEVLPGAKSLLIEQGDYDTACFAEFKSSACADEANQADGWRWTPTDGNGDPDYQIYGCAPFEFPKYPFFVSVPCN